MSFRRRCRARLSLLLIGLLTIAGSVTGPVATAAGVRTSGAVTTPSRPVHAITSAAGFVHPGVLVNTGQLEFVRRKVAQGVEPWRSALVAARASAYADEAYTPQPVPVIKCGPTSPDIGCDALLSDATAAYTQALAWYYTGHTSYARTAIRILDAWASTQTGQEDSDGPLYSAWAAELFPRAAEIIRYTYPGWPSAKITRFSNLLTQVYRPAILGGDPWANSNWELAMADGLIDIGVFTDSRKTFDAGVTMWQRRVPAYIYLKTDGPQPITPPGGKYDTTVRLNCFWLWTSGPNYNACVTANPAVATTTFYNGQTQEFCRDFTHVGMSYAAIIDAAETARMQGVNLYAQQATRLITGLEFAAFMLDGARQPSQICTGSAAPAHAKLTLTPIMPTWEIGYDEFGTRAGQPMTHLAQLVSMIRPTSTFRQAVWETLTSYGTGKAG